MHIYTETESKYTGKMGDIACDTNVHNNFEVKNYAKQSKAYHF